MNRLSPRPGASLGRVNRLQAGSRRLGAEEPPHAKPFTWPTASGTASAWTPNPGLPRLRRYEKVLSRCRFADARWAVLVCLALQIWVWPLYAVGDYNDDASYLGLARSLAQGLPYQNLFDVGAPAEVRFPPGYPLVLVPLQFLFPHQLWLARLQACAFSLAAVAVWVAMCRRLRLPWAPWLLALNPFWAYTGTTVMSESLFTLGVLLYLGRLEQVEERRWRDLFVLGFGAALCYYVRAVGLMLVPATILWRWRCDGRGHFCYLAGFALGAGPHALGSIATGYGGEFAGQQTALTEIVGQNLTYIPLHYGAVLLGYPLQSWPLLFWLVFGLALVGLVRLRRRSPALIWTLCYLSAMLCWPFYMPRFAVPVLPCLGLGLAACLPRPWLALVMLAQLGSALTGRPPSLPPPPAEVAKLVSRIPPGQQVACESMDLGVYADVPTYGEELTDLVEREWLWEQGLIDHNVGLVVLVDGDQKMEPRFADRKPLYQRVYQSPRWTAYTFLPTPAQRRALLLHTAAREALQQRSFETAERLFERAQQLYPEHATLHSGHAYALAQLQRVQEAAQEARRALELDPKNQEAQRLWQFLRGFATP